MLSVSGDFAPRHWQDHPALHSGTTADHETLLTNIKPLRTIVELLLTATRSLLTISHPLHHLRPAVNHYWTISNEHGQSLNHFCFLWHIEYNCKIFRPMQNYYWQCLKHHWPLLPTIGFHRMVTTPQKWFHHRAYKVCWRSFTSIGCYQNVVYLWGSGCSPRPELKERRAIVLNQIVQRLHRRLYHKA